MGPPGRLVTIKRSGVDGARFPLSLSSCSFGRDIECDIRIQLPVVSKLHCRIEVRGQEATLYNFSSTNPTQLNGSAIDRPVHLKHGDVITIIDRSFRYEKETPQHESKPDEFPGKGQEKAPVRRSSRSSLSAPPDGKAQDSRAHSKVSASRSQEPGKAPVGDSTASYSSEHREAPDPPCACSPEQVGSDGRQAGPPPSRCPKESPCGDLRALPSAQSLDSSQKMESPFEKLYQSMKEELSFSSQKQSMAQNQRRSGLQPDCARERERRESQPWASQKARRRSSDTSYVKAASPSTPETNQPQEQGIGEGSAHTSCKAQRSSTSMAEARTKTPGRSSLPQKDTGTPIIERESVTLGAGKDIGSAGRIVTPRKRLSGNHMSAVAEGAARPTEKSDGLALRSSSVRVHEEGLPSESREEPFVTPCSRTKNKMQKDFCEEASKWAGKPGQTGSGLPGLSSVDISNFGDSINKTEGASLKRRRVSFGGHLRPELFDENLPPNTPLKRGETPGKRKSHGALTPAALKKIIKEQPSPGKGGSSSEVRLEVTAQSVCAGPLASSPGVAAPGVSRDRRRSGKAAAASGGGGSPEPTEAPRRAGRKSAGPSCRRPSISRGQHDILQMICSKRRSGASEANLMVAKSWADVVKLGTKQTQMKVVKNGPPKPASRRQRRASTPKKPTASVGHQFSTGHANSPCTIVIGKAQTEKVSVPTRPARILHSFAFSRKMDYSEDLSGITELFKTPVREKPQTAEPGSFTLSNSENLPGGQLQGVNSGDTLLCAASEIQEDVFFSPQNSVQNPSGKYSESRTFQQQSVQGQSAVKTPQNMSKMTRLEKEAPSAVNAPLHTAPCANKLRRSREPGPAQTPPPPVGSEEEEGADVAPAEGVPGRSLRKTPQRGCKVEGEAEHREGSAETCKERDRSKENLARVAAVRRSRSEGQKCGPTGEFLGTPAHAEELDNEADQTTDTSYRSSRGADLPNARGRQLNTPPRAEDDKETPHPLQHPMRTLKTPESGAVPAKGTPSRSGDPAVHAAQGKKGPRTPRKQTQPLDDFAGIRELLQTPRQSMADDKTSVPCQSPQAMPISTKSQVLTPARKTNAGALSALWKLAHVPGGHTHTPKVTQPDFTSIRALEEPAEQILHPVGNVTGSKRQLESLKERTQVEDVAGLQLLQTPGEGLVTDGSTKLTCVTPQGATTRAPGGTQRQPRTSVESMYVKEVSSLRKQRRSAGQALQTPTVPGQEGPIAAFVQTPEQKPDLAGDPTGSKRRSRTSKGRSQLLGELFSLEELFQTPNGSNHSVIVTKTTEIPNTLSQSESVNVPTGVKRQTGTSLEKVYVKEVSSLRKQRRSAGQALQTPTVPGQEGPIAAFVQTPEQKPDLAGDPTGSKRRSRTSKGRSLLLGGLSGLEELFQTPDGGKDPRSPGEATEMPSPSPPPKPVKTPRSTQRRSKTSLGKAGVDTGLPGLGELSQPDACELKGGSGNQEGKPSGKRKLSSEASMMVISKRLRRAPRERAQPLEDLSCLQQLFLTPGHAKDTAATGGATTVTWASPPPAGSPGSTGREPEASLGHMAMEGELSPLRRQRRSAVPQPGGTTSARVLTAEQNPHLTATSPAPRRQTPERRSQQPLGDLHGLRELFQTPDRGKDSVTVPRASDVSSRSPQPEPVRTPTGARRQPGTGLGSVAVRELSPIVKQRRSAGQALQTPTVPGQEGPIAAFVQTPEQKPDLAGDLPGSKRRSRTSKGRSPLLGDLSGLQELFQTPDRSNHPVIVSKATETPSKSPQSESVRVPTGVKRQPRTSLGNVAGKEELRKGRSPGATKSSPKAPRAPAALEEAPTPTLHTVANRPGSQRQPRAPKGGSPPLEDLAGLPELFSTPGLAKGTVLCTEPTSSPAISTGQSGASLGTVPTDGELLGLSQLPREPGGERGSRAVKPSAKRKVEPADTVAGSKSKRLRGAPEEEAQPLDGLAGLQELFQTQGGARDRTPEGTTKMSRQPPQPEPHNTAVSSQRATRPRLRRAGGKEELPGAGTLTRASRQATHAQKAPEGDVTDAQASKESARQALGPAQSRTGTRRLRGAAVEKAQILENPTGLPEVQAPGHAEGPAHNEKCTRMPHRLPQPEPRDTCASSQRATRARLRRADRKEELPVPGPLPGAAGQATHAQKAPERDVTDAQASKESARQALGPAQSRTGTRRLRGARKESTQPPDSLPASEDVMESPVPTEDLGNDENTSNITCPSPQPESDGATTLRHPRTRRGNAAGREETSAPGKIPQTSRSTRKAPGEPVHGGKRVTTVKEPSEPEPAPTARAARPTRLRGAAAEKTQLLEGLAGLPEVQASGHTEDPAHEKSTKMSRRLPQPEPQNTAVSSQRATRARLRRAGGKEELPGAGTLPQVAGQATHAQKAPKGDVTDAQASKESARQALGPAQSRIGTRRLRGARKESTQPPDGPPASEDVMESPVPTEELIHSAITLKPLKTSRRVLRAPKEKPVTSLIPKGGPGEDGPDVQCFVNLTPLSTEEKPAMEERPAPSRRPRRPAPSKVLPRSRLQVGEEQSGSSMHTDNRGPKDSTTAANQRTSLHTRHQKNPSAEQQRPEGLISSEKVKAQRNAKKPEKTAQDTEPQNQEVGGQQPARRELRGGRGGLRSRGQSQASAPLPAEDTVPESRDSPGSAAAGLDVRGSRAKRTVMQPAQSTGDSAAEPRVTRAAKRAAENPKKTGDAASPKGVRARRQRGGEVL